ncbi:hypothetical protein [Candidatus Lokiarchaeum ossiferum]|uniref:hypothetical protein n=1 Tax=Candidatus Lokiarchaeum ossiferum TaxID=2951803 RepID=UPI00352FA884
MMDNSTYSYRCTCGKMVTFKQHTGRSTPNGSFIPGPAFFMFLKGLGILPTAGPRKCLCCEKRICKKCKKGDLCEACNQEISKFLLGSFYTAKILSLFLFISVAIGTVAFFSGSMADYYFNFIYILLGGLGGFIFFWILWNITAKIISKKGKAKIIAPITEENVTTQS